ncbi:MAG: phytanoyl-CoA dioxygenase family protein [Flavobacteriales bacterium]
MKYKNELIETGFSILDNIYSDQEIDSMISSIENRTIRNENHTKSTKLFAIRQLINTVPELKKLLFSEKLIKLLYTIFNSEFFLTKAIYFDKPKESNWFVGYHQDLSISVKEKHEVKGYENWTFKKGQFGVQPPTYILENTVTTRIHLDKTTSQNGALKIISNSHLDGIVRINSKNLNTDNEVICEVKKGGIMLMKPLLFHTSNRSDNSSQRRVIHLEFSNLNLHKTLEYLEYKRF